MKVTIPPREWYEIAGAADRAGVSVVDLLVAAVRHLTAGNTKATIFRDQVADLVEQGVPDPVIAHRLQVPVGRVGDVRRSLGLKPVKFRREQWVHELTPRGDERKSA